MENINWNELDAIVNNWQVIGGDQYYSDGYSTDNQLVVSNVNYSEQQVCDDDNNFATVCTNGFLHSSSDQERDTKSHGFRRQSEIKEDGRVGYCQKTISRMFAPGYRFCPTDAELILFYLRNKVCGQYVFPVVHDVQLYDHHPKELTDKFERERVACWYFFSPRNRKYRNGSRPDRAAGENGSWKPTGINSEIKKPGEDLVIGFRRSLDYYEGKNKKGTRTDWKMCEYTLNEKVYPTPPRKRKNRDDDDPMKLDEWVLCKVYKTRESRKDKDAVDIN